MSTTKNKLLNKILRSNPEKFEQKLVSLKMTDILLERKETEEDQLKLDILRDLERRRIKLKPSIFKGKQNQ